ncbi:hypothetical protein SNK04_013023 [Fusarium graminearum]
MRHFKKFINPAAPANNPKGPTGLKVVFPEGDDSKCSLDVIFVHGLNGGSRSSWTSGDTFWPRDLLPQLLPKARIMTFGFNANVMADCGHGRIRDFASSLWADIQANRVSLKDQNRPFLLICHSMGGLVVKQAIITAKNRSAQISIFDVPTGICFFGTPIEVQKAQSGVN